MNANYCISRPQMLILRGTAYLSCLMCIPCTRGCYRQSIRDVVAEKMANSVDGLLYSSTQRQHILDLEEPYLLPAIQYGPEGKPLSSWRFYQHSFTLVEYDEHWGCRPHWQLSWDDPAQRACRRYANPQFCWTQKAKRNRTTNIVAVVGTGTAFDLEASTSFGQVVSNCILLIEVRDLDIHWMEPRDVSPEWIKTQLTGTPAAGQNLGTTDRGFHVAFGDGEVLMLRKDIPYSVLEPFVFTNSATSANRSAALSRFIAN